MPDTTIRVEPIYYYRPGGYHPTHIGDKFANGRYEVVHKLGFGAHATVWLARDHTGNKFVALKILVASVSGTTDSEVRILRALAAGDLHHEGRRYVSILLDEFEVEGVNGKHQCIVSDVAGCSVSQSKRLCLSKLFPMDVARAVTAQLLLGLSYIHSCGVVHADIFPGNIIFRTPIFDPQIATIQQLYECVGHATVSIAQESNDPNDRDPHLPSYYVASLERNCQSSEQVTDARIMITDFGRSFLKGEDHKFRPPSQFIPPEVLFREQGGQGGDIWTTACTIYEVLGRRPLFVNGKKSPTHLILDMISAMGSPPRTWWERWRMRKKYLNEDGTCKISLPYAPLQSRFLLIGRGLDGPTCALGEVERSALELLLLEMLKYSPTERKTASEAVETLWMKIWGRKALEAYRC